MVNVVKIRSEHCRTTSNTVVHDIACEKDLCRGRSGASSEMRSPASAAPGPDPSSGAANIDTASRGPNHGCSSREASRGSQDEESYPAATGFDYRAVTLVRGIWPQPTIAGDPRKDRCRPQGERGLPGGPRGHSSVGPSTAGSVFPQFQHLLRCEYLPLLCLLWQAVQAGVPIDVLSRILGALAGTHCPCKYGGPGISTEFCPMRRCAERDCQ